jgi:DNA-binding IclR family transcriptional regulator
MLAAMPTEKVSRIIEQTHFVEVTDETITDVEELQQELAEIRERGYAFNREENLDGLHAVGVPVKDPNCGVIGGLSVSGPSHRLTGDLFEDELPTLLLGAANELELNIAHS